jgi:hypothetical protein
MEELPPGSFLSAFKSTQVNAVIVVLERPTEDSDAVLEIIAEIVPTS